MVRLLVPKQPGPPEPKQRRPRRSSAEIAIEREEKQRRKSERAERALRRADEETVRAAQRKLIEEAKAERLKAAVDTALRDADRAIARIAARKPMTSDRWDRERKQEQKRMRVRRRALQDRHAIAREEPAVVLKEREWLAANDRPVIEIADDPEPVIPGMVGMVSEVRRHAEPIFEQAPAQWTGKWVMKRIGEAYIALARLPGNDRPAGFGRAWPAYLTEFADEVGQKSTRSNRATTVLKVATIEDIERMDAVFSWPAAFLSDAPEASRALFKWASSRAARVDQRGLAMSFGMAPSTFRRFRLRAAALLARRLTERGVKPF